MGILVSGSFTFGDALPDKGERLRVQLSLEALDENLFSPGSRPVK